MNPSIVLARFVGIMDAESALSNLDEAEIDGDAISVVAAHEEEARLIHGITGPLGHATAKTLAATLVTLGVKEKQAKEYQTQVQHGDVCVGVYADSQTEKNIQEILQTSRGEDILVIPSSQ